MIHRSITGRSVRVDHLPLVRVEAVDVRVQDVQPVDVPQREERSSDHLLERVSERRRLSAGSPADRK